MIESNSKMNEMHDQNCKKFGFDLNPFVSIVSTLLVFCFILYTLIFPNNSSDFFSEINYFVTSKFNGWFVLIVNLNTIFILVLCVTKLGRVRLGGKDAKSEFSNFSWYSMLFSAGIGIGIFFFGVAEPIYHLNIPEGLQSNALYDPFKVMYLHWGIHAWAVYSVVAIAIGYFCFNKGLPVAIRSIFYPILKDKIYTIWGDLIDTVAVLSVLFGLSTSLGLGARQINAGLHYVFGIPYGSTTQLILIVVITFIATLSVVSGLAKGIKILSELNIKMSFVFLGIILIIGPTLFIFKSFLGGTFLYIVDFIPISTWVATTESDIMWQSAWTIFYWAWWFSWSPFVGMFIARISKGRTIRQIIVGTIFIPSLVCFFTMTIMGASAIYINNQMGGVMETAINNDLSTGMFVLLEYLVSSKWASIALALFGSIVVILFFVTSSDSGSLVVDYLTSGGKLHTPKRQRVFWAVLEGLIAASVLVLGGVKALSTLQTLVIIMGLPFSIMFVFMIISLTKELINDPQVKKQQKVQEKK
jgi:choline/carnitine/betaine transport